MTFDRHTEVIPTAQETRPFVVEHHSIDYIPETERHGSVFSLFTLWFAAKMQVTTVVTGALAVILGMPLGWALVAVVVGNVLGGIFMALHSAQGPIMGVPQMIQSRAVRLLRRNSAACARDPHVPWLLCK